MSNVIPSNLLTKRELARKLKKTERSINNLMAARAIEYIKVGGSVRFTPEAVARFIKAHTVHAAA